jgi:hypothetical protein
MQKHVASLMDVLVTPIPTKWQQIGNSYETTPLESANNPPFMGENREKPRIMGFFRRTRRDSNTIP